MFLVVATSIFDDAWPLRGVEMAKAIGRREDRLLAGGETGRGKHVDFVWVVPTFADAQGFKFAIECIEDAGVEVTVREQ